MALKEVLARVETLKVYLEERVAGRSAVAERAHEHKVFALPKLAYKRRVCLENQSIARLQHMLRAGGVRGRARHFTGFTRLV